MQKSLKKEFLEPSDEFTPIPFWFWNDALEEDEISRQIHDFRSKGVMGFVIHPRIGIPEEIQYLSDRFMGLVKFAVSEAAKLEMKVVLYDEAMYPSGSAHGLVVKGNPEYATKALRMIEYECIVSCEIVPEIREDETLISVQAVEKLAPDTINPECIVKVKLKDGKACFNAPQSGQWSVLFFVESFSGGTIRGIHIGEDDGEPNAPPSGDLMNPAAMEKFVALTYDRYYEVLKEYFGTTVIAMFTDEPGVMGRCAMPGTKPWTAEFLNWYINNDGNECDLPLLWFNAGNASDLARKIFQKAINRRLEFSYYSKISDWCQKHGISLTGHPHESDEIGFLKHFHIPGQDIVWRWVAPEEGKGIEGIHSTMGKCSSDAARHMGRRRNSNECFGCCGPNMIHWAFSCDDMKWYLDWLFVRGVNLLYPHAFYYSIDGEIRFGERPPDVGPNNIWWKYYNQISSYIKRMSWLMTDSINTTQVAVLCEDDCLPWFIAKPLYQHQIEFNYLEDILILSDICDISDGFIYIQKQKYRILAVENPDLLTRQLCEKLQCFVAGGGKVIVYNNEKKGLLLDGIIEIENTDIIADEICDIAHRDVFISPWHQDLRVSHVVKDDMHFYLLMNEGENTVEGDFNVLNNGSVEIWDPWQGKCEKVAGVLSKDNRLCIPVCLQRRESALLCIDPSKKTEMIISTETCQREFIKISIGNNWSISGISEGLRTEMQLKSWTGWHGMEYFSGTLAYHTSFELVSTESIISLKLDLGEVHEIAHLYINGIDAGFKMWNPYTFDITSYVKAGHNDVKVEVTNSLANQFYKSKLPSGLLGPVTLTRR